MNSSFVLLLVVSAAFATMADAKKLLFVMTNADRMGDHPTGQYLPEFAHPYNILSKKHEIVFASPKGGPVPIDQSSMDLFKDDPECNDFLKNEAAMKALKTSIPLSDVKGKAKEFDLIFYPGGHGPVVDLTDNEEAMTLTKEVYENGGLVSAVCHGLSGLVNVKLSDGSLLIKGKKITGFSNAEEDAVGLSSKVPYLLETVMIEKGALYEKAPEVWGVKVVTDGQLVTGQNPSSSSELGKVLLKMLA